MRIHHVRNESSVTKRKVTSVSQHAYKTHIVRNENTRNDITWKGEKRFINASKLVMTSIISVCFTGRRLGYITRISRKRNSGCAHPGWTSLWRVLLTAPLMSSPYLFTHYLSLPFSLSNSRWIERFFYMACRMRWSFLSSDPEIRTPHVLRVERHSFRN